VCGKNILLYKLKFVVLFSHIAVGSRLTAHKMQAQQDASVWKFVTEAHRDD
jgi:hypothetical protein